MANSKLTSVKFTDDDFNCIVENDCKTRGKTTMIRLILVNVLVRHCLTVLYDENYMEVEFIGITNKFNLHIIFII